MKDSSLKSWPTWPIYGDDEANAVSRVIKSNQLYADKEVKCFERLYADYLNIKHCLGLGNATQALHLAITALGIGEGDEVLVTSYSWISTASCVLMQNAVPVFCDIESDSLGICPEDLESKITSFTKAVIITHMFGYPAKIKQVREICLRHGLYLIEDASHAHGACVDNQKIGTFGDISVFSLHQRKSLSVGDGGLLCTNNDKIAEKVFRLRSFGHNELSYNYRMTEFAAAIGQCGLAKLENQNETRRNNAINLSKLLKSNKKISVKIVKPNEVGVYHAVLLEVKDTWYDYKSTLVNLQDAGVPIRETWQPLHLHPHFNPKKYPARGLPWKHPNYRGEMRDISYKSLDLPIVSKYCPSRILELYVHPPCNFENLIQLATFLGE